MRPMRLGLLALLLLAVGGAAIAAPAAGSSGTTFTYNAGLNGQKEVPGPGDKDASGHARITIDTTTGSICWELQVRRVDGTVTAAHIHVGDRQSSGGVVLPLTPPTNGTSSGCATDVTLANAITADPSGYYVNVHSTVFPSGAVRGQLAGRRS